MLDMLMILLHNSYICANNPTTRQLNYKDFPK